MGSGGGQKLGRVLVLGDYRQSVTVARSLARAGYEITLGTELAPSSTGLSHYVDDVWLYDHSSPARFYNHLEAFLRNERPDYVFTVGESQLRRLIEAAARFEPLATWVNPDFDTVARCFDKRAMYELAPALGVPSVAWSPFTDAEDWRSRARAMGFPVVVKRKDSAGHVQNRKALIYESEAAFEAFLAALPREADPASLVLQKFARGARHNCHIAADQGRLVAFFQQKVLRTDEADDTGIGVAGVSVPPSAELRAYCEKLTTALRYHGIGCIQFLIDEPSGAVAFLEFNARMDSTAALPYRLGFDYPLLAVQLAERARGRSARHCAAANAPGLTRVPAQYPAGVTYHWLYGDLGAFVAQVRAGKLDAFDALERLGSMLWLSLRSHHLTFDWRDPLPTLHMFWRKYLHKRIRRRIPVSRPATR